MADKPQKPTPEDIWRAYLLGGEEDVYGYNRWRRFYKYLPGEPRCKLCYVPFSGLGGTITRALWNKAPSRQNPQYCNICEEFGEQHQGGAEIELTVLFADVRGSTSLAEKVGTLEFSNFIDRFFTETTNVLINHDALIEKIIGDEVTAVFVPGWAGRDHAKVAIEAARQILKITGHGTPALWAPTGIGVHTGKAYVGMVGQPGGVQEIVVLGDDINIAARLASLAKTGQIVVSETSYQAADMDKDHTRHDIKLKGRQAPVEARILRMMKD